MAVAASPRACSTVVALFATSDPLDPNHGTGSKHPGVTRLFLAKPTVCSYKSKQVE